MGSINVYSFLADVLLVTHVAFVAFILLGLILVWSGYFLSWRWVRNPWFRTMHLLGIGFVVVQSWLGEICPLTTWEMALRTKGGETVYHSSFITHWLQELLYYQAAPWVFIVGYTVFGSLVLASWFFVRPRAFHAPSVTKH